MLLPQGTWCVCLGLSCLVSLPSVMEETIAAGSLLPLEILEILKEHVDVTPEDMV